MSEFYAPSGRRIAGVLEWAEQYDEMKQGVHLSTKVGPVWVSTVWLGLDHSFGQHLNDEGDLVPSPHILIFETMVFVPKMSGYSDWECERYSTIEQAVAGHWAMVRKARKRWLLYWVRAWAYRARAGR